jgi:hypothetical protein
MLVQLEEQMQDRVDDIWRHISTVDAVGRIVLAEECGGLRLNDFLSGARNIAKLLTKVRRALDSTSDSLVCERISPLYTETIHELICTEFADAAAWGSVTFCLLGVSIMVLISLRASWRLKIAEEKIYHDENEVAENMIVDEHEEYLAYISKYKHEWQEYNGFGSTSIRKSTSFSASEEDPNDLSSYHSDSASMSQTTDYTNTGDYSADELVSIASGDISFPSLEVPPSGDSCDAGPIVPVPPPLLTSKLEQHLEESQSQEPMLFDDRIENPPGNHYMRPSRATSSNNTTTRRAPELVNRALEEEEKVEVDAPDQNDNAAIASAATEESTDYSSIGRNAGLSTAGLYWRDQLGLGIEVAMSSVSDSLVVSPNSDRGATSFDLTKTPSPKKSKVSCEETGQLPRSGGETGSLVPTRAGGVIGLQYTAASRARTDPLVPHSSLHSSFSQRLASCDSRPGRYRERMSKQDPLSSSIDSSGTVKFNEEGLSSSPVKSHVKQQVVNFSKTGPKIQDRPRTPTRTKKRLFDLVRKFDAKPFTFSSDDEQTI